MDRFAKQVLLGNLLLIACCAFYLLWWLLAFKPTGAVKGMKSGWLLIPAVLFGVAAVVLIIRGISSAHLRQTILPPGWFLPAAAVAYLLLAAGTWFILKRPVTTELILIVAWTALTLAEVNMLYGTGRFPLRMSCGLMSVTVLFALIDMAAYVLYYQLDAVTGYIDGMIPLILAAVMMGAISVKMVI